jgi:shikimate dehydrogenase
MSNQEIATPASCLPPPASSISAHTRQISIIGSPIEHSLTPRIQNAALREIGADIVNTAFHVQPENLEKAVRGAQALGMLGLMVTIPHKESVLALCDELDQSARDMGAANLLHFHSDGKIIGYSSDGWAAIKSLEENEVIVRGARISIIGGGGAARSLALTFARAGAKSIMLWNRTIERAERIADEINQLGESCTASIQPLGLTVTDCDLLVNTTSVGMHPHENESPVPMHLLGSGIAVYDIVYNPLETRLLREAKSAGAKTIDGLGMLIYTNVRAVQICAGLEISAATMRSEALSALAEKEK